MQYLTDAFTKLQDALDSLDNFEASNRLNADQIEAWIESRTSLVDAMEAVETLKAITEGE